MQANRMIQSKRRERVKIKIFNYQGMSYDVQVAAAETIANETLFRELSDIHFNQIIEMNSSMVCQAIFESEIAAKRLSDEQFNLLAQNFGLDTRIFKNDVITARLSDAAFNLIVDNCGNYPMLNSKQAFNVLNSKQACARLTKTQFDAIITRAFTDMSFDEDDFLALGFARERFSADQENQFKAALHKKLENPEQHAVKSRLHKLRDSSFAEKQTDSEICECVLLELQQEKEHGCDTFKVRLLKSVFSRLTDELQQKAIAGLSTYDLLVTEHFCIKLTDAEFASALEIVAENANKIVDGVFANGRLYQIFHCRHIIERMSQAQFDKFVNASIQVGNFALTSPFSFKRLSGEQFDRLIAAGLHGSLVLDFPYICERLSESEFHRLAALSPRAMLESSPACARASNTDFNLALTLFPHAGIELPHVCERLTAAQFDLMINQYCDSLDSATVVKRMSDEQFDMAIVKNPLRAVYFAHNWSRMSDAQFRKVFKLIGETWANVPYIQARLKTGLVLKMAEESESDGNVPNKSAAFETSQIIIRMKNYYERLI